MRKIAALLLGLLLVVAPVVSAATLTGRVVRVIDGDTLVLLAPGNREERIRLAGIDCPERGQPFGKRAKEALADQVAGATVVVDWNKRDRYGRIVGKILSEDKDVNLALVQDGMCWWYRKYAGEQSSRDQRLYREAEETARAERRGLWRDKDPAPPWVWRRR